jgi:hypothetical protein
VAPSNKLPGDISIGHLELITSVTQRISLSALWLAAFYYTNPLFWWEYHCLFVPFFLFMPTFS